MRVDLHEMELEPETEDLDEIGQMNEWYLQLASGFDAALSPSKGLSVDAHVLVINRDGPKVRISISFDKELLRKGH